MDALQLIDTYYAANPTLRNILLTHSQAVAAKALTIAHTHPELKADVTFLHDAAILHDIGIIFTHAPGIACHGTHPYIAHGYLGAHLLRQLGYHKHALVCERHTGAGITLQQIIAENLPLPHRELMPITTEEQIICFADKFFSKTNLTHEKSLAEATRSLQKFGAAGVERFHTWCERFL